MVTERSGGGVLAFVAGTATIFDVTGVLMHRMGREALAAFPPPRPPAEPFGAAAEVIQAAYDQALTGAGPRTACP